MGIDPVTHTPRLDLLELYSILNSSLHNSSQLNLPSLLGIGPIANPNLLSLATALLSSQCKSPNTTSQYLQQNQLDNILIDPNQFQSTQPIQPNTSYFSQEIQPCAALNPLSTAFQSETQLTEAKMEQFSPDLTNFNCHTSVPNLWQNNGHNPAGLAMRDIPLPKFDPTIIDHLQFENQILKSNNNEHVPNFSFGSLISTTSSTPTPLNSSSTITYANCSIEDERDSYGSNILMYDMPHSLSARGLHM